MGVGDDGLGAAQPTPTQLAQELGPEHLRLGGADIHAQHRATAVGVDADRDDDGDRNDAMAAADFDIRGIQPDIGRVAFDPTIKEGLDPVIDFFAQVADLAFGDAGATPWP